MTEWCEDERSESLLGNFTSGWAICPDLVNGLYVLQLVFTAQVVLAHVVVDRGAEKQTRWTEPWGRAAAERRRKHAAPSAAPSDLDARPSTARRLHTRHRSQVRNSRLWFLTTSYCSAFSASRCGLRAVVVGCPRSVKGSRGTVRKHWTYHPDKKNKKLWPASVPFSEPLCSNKTKGSHSLHADSCSCPVVELWRRHCWQQDSSVSCNPLRKGGGSWTTHETTGADWGLHQSAQPHPQPNITCISENNKKIIKKKKCVDVESNHLQLHSYIFYCVPTL